jgi:hypothetical protein
MFYHYLSLVNHICIYLFVYLCIQGVPWNICQTSGSFHWLILSDNYYINRSKSLLLRSYGGWKGRKLNDTLRLNEIILIEEMNQLHRNDILLTFNVRCDVTYVLKRLAVWSGLLHWQCTSELVLKQYALLSIFFHDPYESSTIHDAL